MIKTKTLNAPILVECCTSKHEVTSATEYESAGVFHNAKTAIYIQYILNEIGHPQPTTWLEMDNNIADNFIKNSTTQKSLKHWTIGMIS